MPLTIETGAGIPNANSYATVSQARAYAAARGLTLPASDTAVEAALVMACDKLQTYRYRGSRVDTAQALQWPREDVYLDDSTAPLDSASIPAELLQAQCQLAYDATQTELQPTGSGREVVREKVDVLEVQYAPKGSGSVTPQFNKAEAFLAPFLSATAGFGIVTLRA
jgi:hypothetical protein